MMPLPLLGAPPVAYVVDLSSLARGLFETLPPSASPEGEPIAVTAAVALRLVRLIAQHRPAFLAICADGRTEIGDQQTPEEARLARYWRARIWPEYKAGRVPPGGEYDVQINRLIDICQAHRIPVFRRDGLEADDFVGMLAPKLHRIGLRVVIVSKDHDLWQLVRGEEIVCWDGSCTTATTAADVETTYGVPPAWLPALLALTGDGDEAPGLPGIGTKTAAALIVRHAQRERAGAPLDAAGVVERVLSRWQWETTAAGKPSKVGRSLQVGAELARLSLQLVELREDLVRYPVDLAELRVGWSGADAERVRGLGEALDIAVLRACPARPKPPLRDETARRWLDLEGSDGARIQEPA